MLAVVVSQGDAEAVETGKTVSLQLNIAAAESTQHLSNKHMYVAARSDLMLP